MRKHGFLISLDIVLIFYSISVSSQSRSKLIGDSVSIVLESRNNTNDRKAGTTGNAKRAKTGNRCFANSHFFRQHTVYYNLQ
jgi:hypothetical protein